KSWLILDSGNVECEDGIHLSLSRLNHWLPRCEAHPEVMQRTTEFHHQIADTLLPRTNAVLHNTTALDTAVDMLDPQPTLSERLSGNLFALSRRDQAASWR